MLILPGHMIPDNSKENHKIAVQLHQQSDIQKILSLSNVKQSGLIVDEF